MYIIGITGNICSGKTYVGEILKKRGYLVINFDDLLKEVLIENEMIILEKFPELRKKNFLGNIENKILDKEKLKRIIFNKEKNYKKIQNYLHFKIFLKTLKIIIYESIKFRKIIFLEIPFFFEYNLDLFFDSIFVKLNKHKQAKRIFLRDGNQFLEQKLKFFNCEEERAKFVIDNNFSRENTEEQIGKLRFHGLPIYLNVLICYFVIKGFKLLISKCFF